MNEIITASSFAQRLAGTEHWTTKEGNVKLYLWNKCAGDPAHSKGIVLFVHGSSMASQPTFDLDVPGRPDSSVMEWFAHHGYDTWCVDMEGYGRSEKGGDNNAPIPFGADRHLCGHVLKTAGGRPGKNHGADAGHARPVGRHRELRGPERLLRQAAQPRQAVHRHGRHLACELPAEELHDGVPHPDELLRAAGAGVSGGTLSHPLPLPRARGRDASEARREGASHGRRR